MVSSRLRLGPLLMCDAPGHPSDGDLTTIEMLGCGAIAGACGQTMAYPFDVARRRLQVSGWQGVKQLHADHGQAVKYNGMIDCFVRTVREEGFKALFKVDLCCLAGFGLHGSGV